MIQTWLCALLAASSALMPLSIEACRSLDGNGKAKRALGVGACCRYPGYRGLSDDREAARQRTLSRHHFSLGVPAFQVDLLPTPCRDLGGLSRKNFPTLLRAGGASQFVAMQSIRLRV